MPAMKDKDIVKIAVEMENQNPQLIEFDQKRPLKQIIQTLCTEWNITDPVDQYALQFSDREIKSYITEKNRNEIKNGSILRLTFSSSRTAGDVLETLRFAVGDERKEALNKLVKLSCDHTFATDFINKQGKDYLATAIEQGSIRSEEGLGSALESFVELMNHGICSWDSVEPKFIGKIANQVNSAGTTPTSDPRILVNSLAILESIVTSGTQFNSIVEAEVTLPNLITHVHQNVHYPEIQQNSVALINALFHKSDLSKRKAIAATLSSKHVRNVILNSVINNGLGRTSVLSNASNQVNAMSVGSEMAHQLYVLQSLMGNLFEERMQVASNTNSSSENESKEKVNELRKLAFESDVVGGNDPAQRSKSVLPLNSAGFSNQQEECMKLGFTNCKNPTEDFCTCPPGLFSLDLILYFARNYTESYVKVVLENCCRADREHECPFVRSSIQLTELLSEILKLCESPSDEGKLFYPMFFTHDHPIEEFFCICVQLLNKTWKEMRATVEDFGKVFAVLRQQLSRSLEDAEATTTFEKFKQKLTTLSYSEIMNLWQKERTNREEWENKAKAILELREAVKPEILELISQQRRLYLTEGTHFVKYNSKGQRTKDKFWFCRLSSNFKVFHYGDCEENKVPSIDELCHKLPIIEVKSLVIGRECPHMKENKSKKSTFAFAFSLMPDSDQDEPLNFVAPSEKAFDYWTDGINALIGNEMVSKETKHDLEMLLSMDIKLRLLDTEGVTIPTHPPEVPPPPANYDFAFKY